MSNVIMNSHSMTFVTIGNRVSPSSSVNGDPLFDFPDHWQPRFSAQFPFRPTSGGVWCLAPAAYEIRCLLMDGASNRRVTNGLGGPCLRWFRDRFVAQLFFGSNPVLDIFSVFAAALKIQLMSPASDLFSRWFSASNHGKTSLVVL